MSLDDERATAWLDIAIAEHEAWDYRAGGDCFAAALIAALEDDTLTLCHGEPIGTGPENRGQRYSHAWCERIEQVTIPANTARLMPHDAFELSLAVAIDRAGGRNTCLPREVYYRMGHIIADDVRRYERAEVLDALDQWRHFGPWDDEHPPS